MPEGRVLVVEDDPVQRDMLKDVLGSAGLDVHLASTLAEGRRMAEALAPALAIVDQHLPDGNGFELCRDLKERPALGRMRIILITGTYDKNEIARRRDALGAAGWLLKPYSIEELLRLVVRAAGEPSAGSGYPK